MACVCPPKEESDKKAKILCKLKKLLKDIEDEAAVPVNPICVPCCVPICNFSEFNQSAASREPPKQEVIETPNVMVCYKIATKKQKDDSSSPLTSNSSPNRDPEVIRLKSSTSRELRASILYRGCDCEKRSGLQDDCPRTGCHGSPECLTKPPTCSPSEFCDGKHLAKKTLLYSRKAAKANGLGNGNGGDSNNSGNSSDNDNRNSGDIKDEEVRYKCFPAVLKAPVCCPPCQV